jgi:hypothetical protein
VKIQDSEASDGERQNRRDAGARQTMVTTFGMTAIVMGRAGVIAVEAQGPDFGGCMKTDDAGQLCRTR